MRKMADWHLTTRTQMWARGMERLIPQFGTLVSGQEYVLRPGGYAVMRNGAGEIAVVLTPQGVFLPGGAQHPGESPESALVREVVEECSRVVRVVECIGIADEFVFAEDEQMYFRKRCTFFDVRVEGSAETPATEPDHQLAWLSLPEALAQLRHESHRWAVTIATSPPRQARPARPD